MSKTKIPPKQILIKDFDGGNVPNDFEFPSIGIENIDRAVFDLFNETLNFQVTSKDQVKNVPVIFATGERFALTRRKNPIRDKNNTNILPLISIVRQNLDIGASQGGKKTAIAVRAQPNYTVRNKLSEKDRNFQNLVNKSGLRNQDNVAANNNFIDASNSLGAQAGKVATRREKSNLQFSKTAQVNLKNNLGTNIFEIIQIPYPYFITMTYNITFWCQYMQQGNQMIEYLLNKIDVPGGEFAIKTNEGFELVAFIGDTITFDNNFDGMTDDERLIKYNFELTLPGYILNSKVPGLSSQVRSYFSAPSIDFTYNDISSPVTLDYQPETDKESIERHVMTDLTNTDSLKIRRGESNGTLEALVENPFSNNSQKEFLRVKNVNSRTGESVVSSRIVKEIDRQYE
tara:strand:- start:12839 stop:14041 length:1203 start_codon:yes stop_codon:yes gene_type:complete